MIILKTKKRKIATVVTVWLTVIVFTAYAISAVLTYLTLKKRSEEQSNTLVRQNVEDVTTDILVQSNAAVTVTVQQWVKDSIPTSKTDQPEAATAVLAEFCKDKGMEVNVVDNNGKIVASSVPEKMNKSIYDDKDSEEFKVLLNGEQDEYQKLLEPSDDDSKIILWGGKRFEDGSGFLQIGLTQKKHFENIGIQAKYSTTNRRIGEKGFLVVCSNKLEIINSFHNEHDGKKLSDTGIDIDTSKQYDYKQQKSDVFGESSYVTVNSMNGFYVIGVLPVSEAIASTKTMMYASILVELGIFAILFVTLFVLIRKLVVKNLVRVNDSLEVITKGELDEKIDVRDTYEFDLLSNDINATVDKLKTYIAEAAARIDADLAVSKAIQTSTLPNIFPPFPDNNEFELYATMAAAKEVGGDFYDFYMLNNDTLGILIADVSGKSIPGAMFMMTAKTVIKDLAQSGLAPADVFTAANKKLCEGNDAEMFVTAWMGYLELKTGLVHIVNAGHNPPVLIRDGKADYVKIRPNLVLAGLDGLTYNEHTLQLQKGDILFLYTDGVTEAMNTDNKLYGEDRLKDLLSFGEEYPEPTEKNGIAEPICTAVAKDISEYAAGAEQSDDITMICIRYLGSEQQ